MTRALLGFAAVLLALMVARPAAAALPPFELVQKSIAKARADQKTTRLDLRVTETSGELTEWKLAGQFSFGDTPQRLGPKSSLARRLLWIATLDADPVATLSGHWGFVNARVATVGVQDRFVYVYGTLPAVSVFRDLRRLAAFSIRADGHRWVTRLSWSEEDLVGVMITRDGRTVLTARAATPAAPRGAHEHEKQ